MSKSSGMKINAKEAKLLYILGGVILLVAALQLVFRPYQEKKQQLEEEMKVLNADITNLKALQANEAEYRERSEDMQAEIEEIFDILPPIVTAADDIIYAKRMEEAHKVNISTVSFATESTVSYVMGDEGNNPLDNGKSLCYVGVAMEYTTEYSAIKDWLRDIANDKKRRSVETVTLRYDDENGKLAGSMTINTFCLAGSDREYVPETIDSVTTGTTNLFGKTAE